MKNIYGNELIKAIPNEIERRWDRVEIKTNDSDEKRERKESYMRGINTVTEYLLNLIPTLYVIIANEMNKNEKGYNQKNYINQYVKMKNHIKSEKGFLGDNIKALTKLSNDAMKAKPLLNQLTDTIGKKLKVLKAIRNSDIHDGLTISESTISEKYDQFQVTEDSEETLQKPLTTIKFIITAIVSVLEEENISILSENMLVAIEDEMDKRLHTTGLLCIDKKTNRIYTYFETKISFRGERKEGKNRYVHYETEGKIEMMDTKGFKDNIKVYMGLINGYEWLINDTNRYIIGTENESITLEIMRDINENTAKDPIPYFFQYVIKRIEQNKKNTIISEFSEELIEEYRIEKDINIEDHIKETGEYRIEFYIRKGSLNSERYLTYSEVEIKVEEKKEGTIEIVDIICQDEVMQNEMFEVNAFIRNTGNIPHQVEFEMEIDDREYFEIRNLYEFGTSSIERDDSEATAKWNRVKNIELMGREEKLIKIEIEAVRSEMGDYKLGSINIREINGNRITKKEITREIKILKSFQPRDFHNRVVFFSKYNDSFEKKDRNSYIGIDRIWVKGEAGQGKSRIAKEIKRIVEKRGNTCVTVAFKKGNSENKAILKALVKKLKREIIKYKSSKINIHDIERQIENTNKEKDIITKIKELIDLWRLDRNTPEKFVLQIDDVHFADENFIEKLLEEFNSYDGSEKENHDRKLDTRKSELTIIFYTRTLDGLGALNETEEIKESQKLIHSLLNNFVKKQHTLEKITKESVDKKQIENEEEMIKRIILEIFTPHKLDNEIELLKTILSKKSEANPLILELLIEELVERKIIFWNVQLNNWMINEAIFEINQRKNETLMEAYKRTVEEEIGNVFPEEKLIDRLILKRIENFKNSKKEIIMNLIGIMGEIEKNELKDLGLDIESEQEIMSVMKVKTKTDKDFDSGITISKKFYKFKHHLYEEYWESYFKEKVLPLFEIWNKEKRVFRDNYSIEELRIWLSETDQYFQVITNNNELTKVKEDKETSYGKTTFKNGDKYSEFLRKYILPDFGSKENLIGFINMRKILKAGITIKTNYLHLIKYHFYYFLSESDHLDNLNHFFNQTMEDLVELNKKGLLTEEISPIIYFLSSKIDSIKTNQFWKGVVFAVYSEILNLSGKWKKAMMLNQSAITSFEELKRDESNELIYLYLGIAYDVVGDNLLNSGKRTEALENGYKKAKAVFEEGIEKSDNPFLYAHLSQTLRMIGDIHYFDGKKELSKRFYEKSQEIYYRCVNGDGANSDIHGNFGDLNWRFCQFYLQSNDYSKINEHLTQAKSGFQKAFQINSTYPGYASNLGNVYKLEGELHLKAGDLISAKRSYSDSLVFHQKAIDIELKDARWFSNQGIAYQSIGNLHKILRDDKKAVTFFYEAEKVFNKAIEINKNDARYHANLALCFRNIGDFYFLNSEVNLALDSYRKSRGKYEEVIGINQYDSRWLVDYADLFLLENKLLTDEDIKRKNKDKYDEYILKAQDIDKDVDTTFYDVTGNNQSENERLLNYFHIHLKQRESLGKKRYQIS